MPLKSTQQPWGLWMCKEHVHLMWPLEKQKLLEAWASILCPPAQEEALAWWAPSTQSLCPWFPESFGSTGIEIIVPSSSEWSCVMDKWTLKLVLLQPIWWPTHFLYSINYNVTWSGFKYQASSPGPLASCLGTVSFALYHCSNLLFYLIKSDNTGQALHIARYIL